MSLNWHRVVTVFRLGDLKLRALRVVRGKWRAMSVFDTPLTPVATYLVESILSAAPVAAKVGLGRQLSAVVAKVSTAAGAASFAIAMRVAPKHYGLKCVHLRKND
jgi:hypothetical protein